MALDVATREQMHTVADQIAAADPAFMESDLNDYSPDIREELLTLREGAALETVQSELDKLYDEWEADGFPIAEFDEDDDWNEGDADDLDAFPDPENAPE